MESRINAINKEFLFHAAFHHHNFKRLGLHKPAPYSRFLIPKPRENGEIPRRRTPTEGFWLGCERSLWDSLSIPFLKKVLFLSFLLWVLFLCMLNFLNSSSKNIKLMLSVFNLEELVQIIFVEILFVWLAEKMVMRMSQSRSSIVGFVIPTCIPLRMNGGSPGTLLFQGMMLFFHHFLMLISRYILLLLLLLSFGCVN